MSSHHAHDEVLDDDDHVDPRNPYASATRWRHEESSQYRKHASGLQPREPEAKTGTGDLADFLNKTRVEPDKNKSLDGAGSPGTGAKSTPIMVDGAVAQAAGEPDSAESNDPATAVPQDGRTIVCGPLLNYRRMEGDIWVGSVLLVVKGGGETQPFAPTLVLRRAGEAADAHTSGAEPATNGEGASRTNGANGFTGGTGVKGNCLYSDMRNTFWRFDLRVQMEATEAKWEYVVPDMRYLSQKKPQRNSFFTPAITESMRIMFHSCNGFSVGTDEDAWSGPALWNDVMRRHKEAPFHVMLGGGDQIYNDGIRVNGPLKTWTAIGNPKKRKDYPFPEELRAECDDYYLNNYIRWYSTEPFASANGQIPQVNIWDDHDIIDGFGSYVNEFMQCAVFRGIGGLAHKYYMLFQHHLPPPLSTYTTSEPQTSTESGDSRRAEVDPNQMVNKFVAEPAVESNYIIGPKPGPYVAEHSQNIFAKLGARIALLGIDARTERTRHQVNYPETYDLIFQRLVQELTDARESGTPFEHIVLLLGIPIAYPRLTWLENIFSSPILGPIKFANRRFGLGGGLFNHFDGSVDLLDDLDDHYTARTHKKERNHFVERLQAICEQFSVRITILGGDVHLAALGRFYSKPSLEVPTENDFRYMVNVVSSAIVNKPPPQAIANLLARRNKIHHLNDKTDETLLKMFDKDPGDSTRTANHNQVTMPSRNYAIITENSPNNAPLSHDLTSQDATNASGTNGTNGVNDTDAVNGDANHAAAAASINTQSTKSRPRSKDGHEPLHQGEVDAGTKHKASNPQTHGKGNDGGLDICIRVEIDQHDREGKTEAYGLTVPKLRYSREASYDHPGRIGTVPGANVANGATHA